MIIKQDKNAIKKHSISLLGADEPGPVIQLTTRHQDRMRSRGASAPRSGGMSIQPVRPPLFLQEKSNMMKPIQGAYQRPPQFAPERLFLSPDTMIRPQDQYMRHGMLQGDTRNHRIVPRTSLRGSLPVFEQPQVSGLERKAMMDQAVRRMERTIRPVPMPRKIIPKTGELPLFTIT